MFHFYAYSKTSKQLMLLTPKQAEAVNRFTDAFIEAQAHFKKINGRPWTPSDPLEMEVDFDLKYYNRVGSFLNRQHAIRSKLFKLFKVDVRNEEFDDHLTRRF